MIASNIGLKLRLTKLRFSGEGQILKKQIRRKAFVFVFIKGNSFEFYLLLKATIYASLFEALASVNELCRWQDPHNEHNRKHLQMKRNFISIGFHGNEDSHGEFLDLVS
jgi:hypothetical protein